MHIQKTITGLVVCLVVASSAQSQQITESAPGYLKLNSNTNQTTTNPPVLRGVGGPIPWAMVSNCNRITDQYPIESVGKAQSDSMKIIGKSSYTRLDTNSVATRAFMTGGAPISPALIRANRCYLARGHSSPMPTATYAFLTRRSISAELLAKGLRENNENGDIVVAWLANQSQNVKEARSKN